MTDQPTKLPTKLSDLLLLAVADAKKCEAMPERFRVDMNYWHVASIPGDVCIVCMGGAVMAQTLGVDDAVGAGVRDSRFSEDDRALLKAIDTMRTGAFHAAFETVTGDRPSPEQAKTFAEAERVVEDDFDYAIDRAEWSAYERAAAILAGAGL